MSYYYYDSDKQMVLVNNFKEWINGHGEGDALWRTSIAYITTSDKKYYNGIVKSFKLVPKFRKNGYLYDYHYQAVRCNPYIGIDDVSRDQVILAWSSLYLNGDSVKLEELINHTKYRLSERYLMTPTMWLWSRGLTGNKFLGFIGQIALFIELSFSVLLNKIIKTLVSYEELHPDEIEKIMSHPDPNEPWHEYGERMRDEFLNTKWKKWLWKINFPGYGAHLAAWMNYTSPNNFIKKINSALIWWDASKYNLLLKLLTGGKVIDEEIEQFKSKEEWIWSGRFDKANRGRVLPNPVGDEFDKIILKTIKDRNKKDRK